MRFIKEGGTRINDMEGKRQETKLFSWNERFRTILNRRITVQNYQKKFQLAWEGGETMENQKMSWKTCKLEKFQKGWVWDIIQIKSIGHYIGKFFYIYINVNYTKHLSTSIYLRYLHKKTKIGTFEAFILMKLKEIKTKCNYYTLLYVHINTWILGITALRPIKVQWLINHVFS